MRIIFSGHAAAGHVMPMLPLATAASDAGHVVAILSSIEVADLVTPFRLLAAGPTVAEGLAETARRMGSEDDGTQPGAGAVELFAGTRVDLAYDQALAQATKFAPDLLVCEQVDFVGPMLGAALGVPWAGHGITAPLPQGMRDAFAARCAQQHARRGLTVLDRIAYVDPFVKALRLPDDPDASDAIPVQPLPHGARELIPGASDPRAARAILLTMGTSVTDADVHAALISSLTAAGHRVIVTTDSVELPDEINGSQVRFVGFRPLAELLPQVDSVVCAAGMGTIAASLSAGLPLVMYPVHADQPSNAERVQRAGAGVRINDLADAAAAIDQVRRGRQAAQAKEIARAIAMMLPPQQALEQLFEIFAAV